MAVRTTKVCEHCGCRFVIEDEEAWAYKRYMRMPGNRMCKVHWFHTWSCLVAAQKKADEYCLKHEAVGCVEHVEN